MTKLEKVIQGLEHCYVDNCTEGGKCPYYGEEYCLNTLMYDAMEVLKERKPEETRLVRHLSSRPKIYADLLLHCEKCGGTVDYEDRPKYCPCCGRKVKWE